MRTRNPCYFQFVIANIMGKKISFFEYSTVSGCIKAKLERLQYNINYILNMSQKILSGDS